MQEELTHNKHIIRGELIQYMGEVNNLEEEGYVLDDEPYMIGNAFWYYSPIGTQRITVMHKCSRPTYPQGDWFFIAKSHNGEVIHDNLESVAHTMVELDYILPSNSQEKHAL